VPEGGLLPPSSFSSTAEYNSFFNTFDQSTRANLKATLDNGGPAFRAAAEPFSAALRDAPPALAEIQRTFEQLGGDPASLETLTVSASSVVDAIHRSQPGIGPLVSGAAQTFDAVARESRAVRDTLAETPATLAAARTVLARAEGTLARVGRFSQNAAPGIARLDELTSPLAETLGTVIRVAPEARRTLATARRAGPDLDQFLARLRSIMPALGSVGSQAATQLACIRPYSPEIAGFFSTWGPGAFGSTDDRDTYLRAQLGFYPFPNTLPFGVARLTELYPQVKFAFPRPPGDVAGQPWYQPRCGIGPGAYDPTSAGADG
jgi:phospholipid/cholesterol/gamma-HCH transport system substrate-binding protein